MDQNLLVYVRENIKDLLWIRRYYGQNLYFIRNEFDETAYIIANENSIGETKVLASIECINIELLPIDELIRNRNLKISNVDVDVVYSINESDIILLGHHGFDPFNLNIEGIYFLCCYVYTPQVWIDTLVTDVSVSFNRLHIVKNNRFLDI